MMSAAQREIATMSPGFATDEDPDALHGQGRQGCSKYTIAAARQRARPDIADAAQSDRGDGRMGDSERLCPLAQPGPVPGRRDLAGRLLQCVWNAVGHAL